MAISILQKWRKKNAFRQFYRYFGVCYTADRDPFGKECCVEYIKSIAELFKKKLEYFSGAIALLVFVLLSITHSGIVTEYGMYDTLLHLKPAPRERDDILLVNIDDAAIEEIGAWPWSRDVLADTLIRLREAGGTHAVFDIEYLSPGQTGVNRSYVRNEFPEEYREVQEEILAYLNEFSAAVHDGSIPRDYVPEVSADLVAFIDSRMSGLSSSITGNIFRDNDGYFADALAFFDHAYLTINTERINENDEAVAAEEYARDNLLITRVDDPRRLINVENEKTLRDSQFERGISPAILPLLKRIAGAGFPNVYVDEDGVRRRMPLLVEHEGAYVPQLVFAPIIDILDPERIVRKDYRLVLENALDPENPASGIRSDVVLPLDEDGRLLINWLKKKFSVKDAPELGSFSSISVYAFKYCDELEEKLIDNLVALESMGIRTAQGYLSYHEAALWLHAAYRDLETWKAALLAEEKEDYNEYFAARASFFSDYGEFLEGGFDTEIYDTLERVAVSTGDSTYTRMSEDIRGNFDIYRKDLALYRAQDARLGEFCANRFCIIGYNGVGTSDLGVTPFEKVYPNVGTHANIYNTIMSRQLITPLPRWFSWLVAFLFCYINALTYRRIKSLRGRMLLGTSSTVLVFALVVVLMAVFNIYLPVFVPLLSVFTTFLLVSILRFVFSEQEKSFLRKAFTMYLSSDVVNQIVEDPTLLRLGGHEKQITALFTDIKSFSTLSEKVTPEHLVEILNRYLTVMSDIVLEQKGTIDKYIGDAIVSFFGAPLDLPDHASRACLAAVRMKQAEQKLNEDMLAAGETPMPIYTRIGINTGPMVVGNMGTDNKMNYTIMGNDVNLAARLEGVNKQYGTWILASESTWNATGGLFLGRKLDRVRVVGIDTPVQLYNIMAVRAEAEGPQIALADRFNYAIDAYRAKKFSDALHLFTKCAALDPDDQPTKVFLDRVKTLLNNGIPDTWSDVINMTSK